MKKITKLITSVALLLSAGINAQSPVLLKDVSAIADIGSDPSNDGPGVELDGVYYFAANSAQGGNELWKSDGTEAGTSLVKDIWPGSDGSDPYDFRVFGSKVYFIAYNEENGEELWVTDGTSAGTQIAFDPYPGDDNGSSPSNLTIVGSYMYWMAYDDDWGDDAIYKVDELGVVSTVLRAGEYSVISNSMYAYSFSNFCAVENTLFFRAYSYELDWDYRGRELFKTDGTPTGTVCVKDIRIGGSNSNPSQLTAVGSTLFFVATDGYTGNELWKSDGTEAGTILVNDVRPGGSSSGISNMVALGDDLLFTADDNLGTTGNELWISDGTLAGTMVLNDLYPGFTGSSPNNLRLVGSEVFFTVSTHLTDPLRLFKTDGSSTGTVLVSNECFNIQSPTVIGSELYFNAYDINTATYGYELWKSSGTSAGTVMIKDIEVGGNSSPYSFTKVGASVFFSAYTSDEGYELWKTTGTSAGTAMVKQIADGLTQDGNVSNLIQVGNDFFFIANDGVNGYELWVSDGTEAGSVLVKDINVGGGSSNISDMFVFGGDLYFRAFNGTDNYLWTSNGTSAGTEFVSNNFQIQSPAYFTELNNEFYFSAYDYTAGTYGLCKSDGSSVGTVLVTNITSGGINPQYITSFGSDLYFTAFDGATGTELYKSDGTSAGTSLFKDINVGGSSFPENFVSNGSLLYFWANNSVNDQELWVTDGTSGGTQMVMDINPTGGIDINDYNCNMVALGSNVYFAAYTPTYGYELWKSDGTLSGTSLVKDIYPVGSWSLYNGNKIILNGNTLYFNAYDGFGWFLWKSDGTEAGTVRVDTDQNAWYPTQITSFGSLVMFVADDNNGDAGTELWVSDGTNAGTMLAGDINMGGNSSSPYSIINMNDEYVAFASDNGYTGNELWKYNSPVVITTNTLTSNVVCAEETIDVDYTVTQGALNAGNVFQLQLSDGLGNFEFPTVIGSLASETTTGTVSGTLPDNVSGLTYKVRVVSTNDPSFKNNAGQPVLVSEPAVSISGNLTFCPGSSTNLVASGGVSYSWAGSETGSSAVITVDAAGDLTATATDAYGCTSAKTVAVVADAAPTVTVSGNTSYCVGESTTLVASGATTYSWSPSTGLNDANGAEVIVSAPTSTTYVVTGTGAACSATATVNVVVDPCSSGLGINEVANGGIVVYPNPTNESLTVKMELTSSSPVSIRLVNAQGMLIYSETVTSSGSYNKTIDLSKQSSGLYWLQMTSETNTATKKVVKQ